MSLHEKLFNIQHKVEALTKDTKGYNYKYFDINKMLKELKPLFKEQKILVLQPIEDDRVYTRLIDLETDEVVESSVALTIGAKPQDLGSEITYYRRYTLQSLMALEAEDDDAAKTNNSGYKKAILKPNTPNWDNVVSALRSGKGTMDQVKSKYTLTPANEKKLLGEVG